MPKTRWSLLYVAGYTSLTGLGLLLAPQLTLKLLFANHEYTDAMPQLSGALMIGLSIVIIHVILYGNRIFYRMTLLVRIPMWLSVVGIYFHTNETFLLVILGVTGFGIVMTSTFYLMERGNDQLPAGVRSQTA